MTQIQWKNDGWNTLQEADTKKHIMEINCRTENGEVVEVRIRHSRGEEIKVKVMVDGKQSLPMPIDVFESHFEKNELELRE